MQRVQRVTGDYKTLRLSNDLQQALEQEPAQKVLLKGALIVIPLAPYYKNRQRPEQDGSGAKFTQGECILYHELKLEVFR